MGRGKLKLELVKREKPRLVALKKRKEGLVKKVEQLTTLCDVPACMIIHDPSTNSSFLWPEDSSQVRRLIDSYKANPTAVKPCGLSDFFNRRQKNVEDELAKLRNKNAETKYDDRLDLMDESQLRELGAALRSKAQAVRSRIEFLKREAMVKKENDVMLNLDELEHIDQDDIFSAADVMAAMVKKENDVFIDVPFMDYNYLNHVNENVNWCANQNLNCSSMDVNWFGGDGGGDLASYLWH